MVQNHNTLPPKSRGYQVRDEVIEGAIRNAFGEDTESENVELSREDIRNIAAMAVVRIGTSGLINREAASGPPIMEATHE